MDVCEENVYNMIKEYAKTNSLIQTVSGCFGFPTNLCVDGAVLLTHYVPMINNIRNVYNLGSADMSAVIPVLKGSITVLLADVLFDKFVSNIPLVGIVSNYICAKILTWRLGLLFGYLSKHNLEINGENVKKVIEKMQEMIKIRTVIGIKTHSRSVVSNFFNLKMF